MNRALRPRFVLPALAALAVALLASSAFSANQYATTPASAGAINPKAIPLGDGYVATTPKVGYIDSCTTSFGGQGGAQAVGPWINTTAKTWDNTTKIAVNGAVSWPTASYTNKVVGTKRVITFNDLPINHTTGTFPVGSSDPAANYDRNPNSIAAHSTSWTVPGVPAARATPACLPMGAIGVLTDGVYLFNGLDGEGRDAAAHEVLDACAEALPRVLDEAAAEMLERSYV